jgi:hypothetical protein
MKKLIFVASLLCSSFSSCAAPGSERLYHFAIQQLCSCSVLRILGRAESHPGVLSSLIGLDLAQDLFSCLGLFLAAARVNLSVRLFSQLKLSIGGLQNPFFPSASGQCLLVLPAIFAFPRCCFLNVISCVLNSICIRVFAIQVFACCFS